MNEITNKIEALRAAGFEPKAVLMSNHFHNKICVSKPVYESLDSGVSAALNISSHWDGLPIKLILKNDEDYSIEVA